MNRSVKSGYRLRTILFVIFFLLTGIAVTAAFSGPVYDGPELDYQPSIIYTQPDGGIMMVFERISLPSFFGDMYLTNSADGGQSWSTPVPIIDSSRNERHPALAQLSDDSYVLFYLVDETDAGAYRIHRASSPTGISWTDHGAIDLGWSTTGEINPCVIREADGSLTMTYHRLSGPSYIARSTDDGVTWDTLKTQVSDSDAQLPRLAKREMDGVYLVTYQVGSSNLDMYSKVSTNPYDWSGPQNPFSTAINSHDSQPVVLPGGTFLVTYAQQVASVFDVYYRTSYDGTSWSDAVRVTTDPSHYDTQPHPLPGEEPGTIVLSWSHQESHDPYVDHDIWVDPSLSVSLLLAIDVDSIPSADGGVIQFSLDAGPAFDGRDYFLVGSLSGTSPGTPLPGGGTIPLNRDALTDYILSNYNNPVFVDFRGTLDADGRALAFLDAPGPVPLAVGRIMNFAFTTLGPFDLQSNPVGVVITP